MNSAPAVLILILAIVGGATGFGFFAGRRRSPNLEEWAVGGRGFGTLLVWLLLGGEVFTTFSLLGLSGWAYTRGGPVIYALAYLSLSQVVLFLIGPKIWELGREHRLQTLPDYFALRYGGAGLQALVAVCGIVFLVVYLQLQLTGLGLIVQATSFERIPRTAAMVGAAVLIAGFVFGSGVRGVAWVSVLKDGLLIAAATFVGFALPHHYFGGIGAMFSALNRAKPGYLTMPGGTPNLGHAWYISSVLLTSLAYCWPHFFGSLFTAKSGDAIRRNAIFMPLYCLSLCLILFAGFTAVLVLPSLKTGDLALLTLVRQTYPPWLLAVFGAAGALTAMVPASILSLTASAMFAKNLWRPLTGASLNDRQLARIARGMVIVTIGCALALALRSSVTLVALLLMAYAGIAQFFPGIILGLYWKRVTRAGTAVGLIVGVGLVAILIGKGLDPLWGLNAGFVALLANLAVTAAVSLAAPEPSAASSRPPAAATG